MGKQKNAPPFWRGIDQTLFFGWGQRNRDADVKFHKLGKQLGGFFKAFLLTMLLITFSEGGASLFDLKIAADLYLDIYGLLPSANGYLQIAKDLIIGRKVLGSP